MDFPDATLVWIAEQTGTDRILALDQGGFFVVILAVLMVLIAPAFTTIKSAGDVTSSIYGIKGLLDNARTYAKANHTYVFVGFAEVDGSVSPSSPPVAGYGRVAVAVVASKDGT